MHPTSIMRLSMMNCMVKKQFKWKLTKLKSEQEIWASEAIYQSLQADPEMDEVLEAQILKLHHFDYGIMQSTVYKTPFGTKGGIYKTKFGLITLRKYSDKYSIMFYHEKVMLMQKEMELVWESE